MEELAKWAPWVAIAFHSVIVLTCGWVLFRWAAAGMLSKLRTAVYGMLLAATVALLQIAGFCLSLVGGTTGQTWPKVLAAIGAIIEFSACLLAKWDANRVEHGHGHETSQHLPAFGVLRGSVGTATVFLLISILVLLTVIIYGWEVEPKVIDGTTPEESRSCNSAYGVCPNLDRIIWRPTAEKPQIDATIDRGRPGGFTEHDGDVTISMLAPISCEGGTELEWQLSQNEKLLGKGTLDIKKPVTRIEAGFPNSQNLHLVARLLSDESCFPRLAIRP